MNFTLTLNPGMTLKEFAAELYHALHAAPAPVELENKERATLDVPDQKEPERTRSQSSIAIADLQSICSAKAKLCGIEKVKAVIDSFGAQFMRDIDPTRHADLKLALEALK